jgi:hypothetical protein
MLGRILKAATVTLVLAGAAVWVVRLTRVETGVRPAPGGSFAYRAEGVSTNSVQPSAGYVLVRRQARPQGTSLIAVGPNDFVYWSRGRELRVSAPPGADHNPEEGIRQLSSAPGCLTVDTNGNVYVGAGDHINIYNAQGRLQARGTSLGTNVLLTSIAVSGANVFVADAGNRVVYRCDLTGGVQTVIGRKDPARSIPGFVIPSPYFDVLMGGDGLVRIVNPGRHRVETYTLDGDLESWWGESSTSADGFCGCCNPAHLAALPDGGFVTSEKGLRRVKIYDAKGNFTGVVLGTDVLGEDAEPCGIAVDSRGRIYVADPKSGDTFIFERRGSTL